MNLDIADETPKEFKIKRKKKKLTDIYNQAIINKTCFINMINVGSNIKDVLKRSISNEIEGKCISEGYIKPESVKIISYSSGVINGAIISFEVVFECMVCNPVEGMQITCVAKNITKAGIRAELGYEPSPIVVFIARDHNYASKTFSSIEENQEIKVRVIGQRFELNDTYISIIAELVGSLPVSNKSLKSTKNIKTK